jgi:glycosyltransferase involved in cell wall biosynthesis
MNNIAILIPCYNEEFTIGRVIIDFKRELPDAKIYVYDNNSTDRTSFIAQQEGAIVRQEFRQGKGNVVRSMFKDIEADIYVMIDGDSTYPANFVHDLMRPVLKGQADLVVGDRHSNGDYKDENKRAMHNFGNNLVKNLINKLFGAKLNDIMSGYRVFNRRFVKNIPISSPGFEIETEITLHALDKRFLIKEIPIEYRDRPNGSESKLNTLVDGVKVLKTIFRIFKDYRPLMFFFNVFLIFSISSLLIGFPVIDEFIETGLVAKIPSAILSTGLMLIAVLALFVGFILDTVVRQNCEKYELHLNSYKENI